MMEADCTEEMKSYQVVPAEGTAGGSPAALDASPKVAPLLQPRVYRRRWLMLATFVLVSAVNAFHWIQFSIITNVVMAYYGVDSQSVNWTSLVFMVAYIPLIFPGAWIMDTMGLRVTVIIGAVGTCVGGWIKAMSVSPDLFYVALIGQSVLAVSQVFILGVPPNVAAVWFGPEQVSSACAIGVFGNQLGVALGFLIPPMVVRMHANIDDIGADFSLLYYTLAGISTVLTIIVLFGFQAEPPTPPTAARSLASGSESPKSYLESMKHMVTDRSYMLLLVTYGINVGVFYAMSTLLNQVVLFHFPGEELNAGRIGLTIVVCGMLGSVVCGIVLDKTHRFKETTLAVYGMSVVGMILYTITFEYGKHIVTTFATAGFLGFFMTGYLPVGFEFAAELTHPEPEVTSSGLLNAAAQFFGIILTLMGGRLLDYYGDITCNAVLSASLFSGFILTVLIKSDLKRQRAHQVAETAAPADAFC